MLIDVDGVRSGRIVTDRSFAGLMNLYEQNYIRLRKIAPDLGVANHMISSVIGHCDLFLTVHERCKYTTMLSMTYRFGKSGNYRFEPDLHLKIYHDAKVVEVQHFHSRSKGLIIVDDLLIRKWDTNRYLFKWLGYCLYQGHFFLPTKHLRSTA
ncbi:MAG: hypothetical protein ACI9JR_000179 [Gammaproteobacteria bacterium]|jgi:uncharacterized protein YqiB (DUF1249 family)